MAAIHNGLIQARLDRTDLSSKVEVIFECSQAISRGLHQSPVFFNQSDGGTVEPGFIRVVHALVDILTQDLTQFHTPLIKGIDLPDHTLAEHLVLIECNK